MSVANPIPLPGFSTAEAWQSIAWVGWALLACLASAAVVLFLAAVRRFSKAVGEFSRDLVELQGRVRDLEQWRRDTVTPSIAVSQRIEREVMQMSGIMQAVGLKHGVRLRLYGQDEFEVVVDEERG